MSYLIVYNLLGFLDTVPYEDSFCARTFLVELCFCIQLFIIPYYSFI